MTYTYQYTDTQQQIQSVDVTVTYSNCAPVSPAPDPQSTGFISLKQKSITIEIPNSLLVDLEVYFNFFQTIYVGGNTVPSSATTFFTLRKGNRLQTFTFNCEEVRTLQYAQGNHRTTKDYEFIEQPEGELPEEPDIIIPDRPEEEPYSDVARWWFEFEKLSDGFDPTICRVEIFTKAATTGTTELICMQDTPISIKRRGDSEDIFKPIIGGYADVNFMAFEEDQFKPLFSSRDGEAKIRYYEDQVLFFEGYSVASEYKEGYTDPPYQIRASFTDGIALLKHRTFEIAYEDFRAPALQIVHDILKKIPSSLDVYTHIYTKSSHMSSASDPLLLTEMDVRTFQDDSGKPLKCYEVLESICSTFGARFHSSNAADKSAIWVIDEINSAIDFANNYRVYSAGSLIEKDSIQVINRIIRNVNDNRLGIIINGSGTKKQKNLISEVEITEEKEFIFSLLPDRVNGYGEFNRMDVMTNPVQSWLASWDYNGDIKTTNKSYWEGGNVARALEILTGDHTYGTNTWTINDEDYIESESVSVRGGNAFNLEFRIRFNSIPDVSLPGNIPGIAVINDLKLREGYQPAYLPFQIVLTDPEDSEIKQYSDENGFWSDDVQYIRIAATQYDSFLSYKLENILLPNGGELSFRLFAPVTVFGPNVSDSNQLKELITSAHINYIKNQYLSENDFATTKRTITLRNNAIKSSIAEPYQLELLLGDAETLENVSALSYNGNVTSGWTRTYVSGDTPRSITELAGLKILEQYNYPEALILEDFEILENGSDQIGSMYSYHKPVGLSQYPDRNFLATDWEYIPKSSVGGQSRGAYIRATWVEVRNDEVTDFEIIVEEDNSTSKNNGTGGGGGATTITNNIENDYNIRDVLVSGSPTNPVYVQLTDDNKLAVNLETISGWTGTTPTLQQVTDVGSTTNKTVTAAGFKLGNIDFYWEGIARDVGDLLFRADNLRLQSDGAVTRLTINSAGDIVLNSLTGLTTEVVAINPEGKLSRIPIPNGSGGTGTIPTLQQVTDQGNTTNGQIIAGSFRTSLLDISSGLIKQNQLGGGGAPQPLIIQSAYNVILSGSTGHIEMGFDGRTKFSNTTGVTATRIAGFDGFGNLGTFTLGTGISIQNGIITITGTTQQAVIPTLQQVTSAGSSTNDPVFFNNSVDVGGTSYLNGNVRISGTTYSNNGVLRLKSRLTGTAGELVVTDNYVDVRASSQSVISATTSNVVIDSNEIYFDATNLRWSRSVPSTQMLVLGTNGLITTQAIPTSTDTFVTGATFTSGVLRLNRQNGFSTVNLDGRYALISSSFSGDYNDLNNKPWENLSGIIYTEESLWVNSLAGTGTRMMVVNSNGFVSTQAIPSGGNSFSGNYNDLTNRPWDNVSSTTIRATKTVQMLALSGSTTRMVVVNSSGTLSTQPIPSGGGSDGNNYPTSLSFNTTNGVLTMGRNGLGSLSVDLDNRYALAGSGGGGVSGTTGYLPVFDSSADGVTNSVIRQGVAGYGVVMDSNNFRIGNSTTTRLFVWNGTTETGTLQFENSGRMYWNRSMAVQEYLTLNDVASTPAAVNNACVLFSQGGVLKVRNSNGTIVTLS